MKNSVDFCDFTQPFCHKKALGYILICRNAEGHMVRKRPETPVLAYIWIPIINEDYKLERYSMSRVRGSLNATISGKTNQVSCAFGA